jgi:hypothetical protein
MPGACCKNGWWKTVTKLLEGKPRGEKKKED